MIADPRKQRRIFRNAVKLFSAAVETFNSSSSLPQQAIDIPLALIKQQYTSETYFKNIDWNAVQPEETPLVLAAIMLDQVKEAVDTGLRSKTRSATDPLAIFADELTAHFYLASHICADIYHDGKPKSFSRQLKELTTRIERTQNTQLLTEATQIFSTGMRRLKTAPGVPDAVAANLLRDMHDHINTAEFQVWLRHSMSRADVSTPLGLAANIFHGANEALATADIKVPGKAGSIIVDDLFVHFTRMGIYCETLNRKSSPNITVQQAMADLNAAFDADEARIAQLPTLPSANGKGKTKKTNGGPGPGSGAH
jgi:hypothetical protein